MSGNNVQSSPLVPLQDPYNNTPIRVASYNPIRLTTAEFGARWGHTPTETKRSTRLNVVRSLDQLAQILTTGVASISHVESIPTTSEVNFHSKY